MKDYYCEYFRVKSRNNDTHEENLYNLLYILRDFQVSNYEDNAKPYLDDFVRIEKIYFDPSFDLWFIQLVRIRTKDVPLLCTFNEGTVEMQLEEGQLIAEPVVCLYDPEHAILMTQKNRDSVSSVGIKDYFNEFIEDETILFEQIIDPSTISRIRRSEKTTRIKIRLAEVNRLDNNNPFFQSTLGSIITSMNSIDIPYIELTLSVGRQRSREIDESDADSLLGIVENNPEGFDRVEYTIREEGKSQVINLFSDVIKDKMSFELPDDGILRFDAVSQKMGEIYAGTEDTSGRRDHLIRIVP